MQGDDWIGAKILNALIYTGKQTWHDLNIHSTLLKQTIEKSICKDCGGGKILIRLKIQS